jgi:hypothetical protein
MQVLHDGAGDNLRVRACTDVIAGPIHDYGMSGWFSFFHKDSSTMNNVSTRSFGQFILFSLRDGSQCRLDPSQKKETKLLFATSAQKRRPVRQALLRNQGRQTGKDEHSPAAL